jgi:NAD(P)-dependent dehydrogenase (short-subunit alcohol dehydrogenase family)
MNEFVSSHSKRIKGEVIMKVDITSGLKNQAVLITGGSKGIGKECALAFGEAGARVGIVARNEEEIQRTVQELKEIGCEAIGIKADVSNVEDIRYMMEQFVTYFGTIDILVNSAGINKPTKAIDVTEELWDSMLNINLKGAFFAAQEAAKVMLKNGKGKIINLSSQMGSVGYYDRAPYCASKGGLDNMIKALAVEWAPYICINNVAPTFVETPFTEGFFKNEDFLKEVISRIPMGRIGQPKDIVGAVIYLASEYADMVTGTTLKVDGGWTAW